jgi:UDP-N-acetylglucosamine 2-epimerase (non-hydrolysing)
MRPGQTLPSLHARLLKGLDALLESQRPDFALVQGDTTTVLAAAQACFYRHIPVGHVEAGLRTGDLHAPFPEEANRRQAAVLTTLHFAPTAQARDNLLAEGVPADRVTVTGNTVIDALRMEAAKQEDEQILRQIDVALVPELGADWRSSPYVLVTGHRRENFGEGMRSICAALVALAERYPATRFVYPVHLNPRVAGPVHELLAGRENIQLIGPKDYRLFVALMRHCTLVLTDSGGVQEEAPTLGKPVLVMRDTTERPEGVAAGTARLVGADTGRIVEATSRLLDDPSAYEEMAGVINPYGNGEASPVISAKIRRYFAPHEPLDSSS